MTIFHPIYGRSSLVKAEGLDSIEAISSVQFSSVNFINPTRGNSFRAAWM